MFLYDKHFHNVFRIESHNTHISSCVDQCDHHSIHKIWTDVVALRFDESVKKLDVPVFLFQGDHDQNTPTVLAKEWFDNLEAPYKEYVPFHESAHSPIKEEPELWGNTLKEKLLALEKAQPTSC